jgi:hypothetical protein
VFYSSSSSGSSERRMISAAVLLPLRLQLHIGEAATRHRYCHFDGRIIRIERRATTTTGLQVFAHMGLRRR